MAKPNVPSNVITEHPQNGDDRVTRGNEKLNKAQAKQRKKLKKAAASAASKVNTG